MSIRCGVFGEGAAAAALDEAAKAAAQQSEPDLTCSLRLPGLSHTAQHVQFGYKTRSLHRLRSAMHVEWTWHSFLTGNDCLYQLFLISADSLHDLFQELSSTARTG